MLQVTTPWHLLKMGLFMNGECIFVTTQQKISELDQLGTHFQT